ncbi:MAG TPA: large conductance mechanosensitive channel protein MscL [Ruminiclostridium sp.]|nr:large conductance mechanosensitive channel protein MscL [Ruminiclostridium sp.]
MKKFINEFREFAIRGNVIDLAVAVIIGNAINKVVSSLVNDIFMPVLGLFVGKIDITSLAININSRFTGGKPLSIGYGIFLQNVLNFLTQTFCIFIILKFLNKIRNFNFLKSRGDDESEEESELVPTTEELLIEIRDLLKEKHADAEAISKSPDDFKKQE